MKMAESWWREKKLGRNFMVLVRTAEMFWYVVRGVGGGGDEGELVAGSCVGGGGDDDEGCCERRA